MKSRRHDITRGHGMKSEMYEEQQLVMPLFLEMGPTDQLMERVTESENLWKACKRVKANKGAPGVDGRTTNELEKWLRKHEATLRVALLEGNYTPHPVKGVQIPKPGGGIRQLGIPTTVDRMIQQAIAQVIEPIFDPTFSTHSYGFRPGRSAHQALTQASQYVEEGRKIVVDIDLEKFFDRVNHDILMGKLAKRIKDVKLLNIIRQYLRAGMMQEGVCIPREEGSPQGGPLSPLLSNILLDQLDKELEKRGHRFCRYADDCNIYVRTEEAGLRVMQSITEYIETKLKLKVNREKSCVAPTVKRKFLGYRIYGKGELTIAPQSIKKFKEKIRTKTKRKTGGSMKKMIETLNNLTRGWVNYFQLAKSGSLLSELDGWIRRRLRAIKLKQLKRPRTIAKYLMSKGVTKETSWKTAKSGKGIWRISNSPGIHRGMRNRWAKDLGLESMKERWGKLAGNLKETAVYGTVRTVV